jgi:hypothetical protein
VSVLAPTGTVNAVTVDDTSHTYYNASPVNLLQTVTEKLFPTPGVEADFNLDQFVLSGPPVGGGGQPPVPAPGFTFTINVTPTGGSPVPSQSILVGNAGEPLNLIAPSFAGDHSIGAAPVGKSLTVKWTLPQSYATSTIALSGTVRNAACTMAKAVTTASSIAPTADFREDHLSVVYRSAGRYQRARSESDNPRCGRRNLTRPVHLRHRLLERREH